MQCLTCTMPCPALLPSCLFLKLLVFLMTVSSPGVGDVFTSTSKIAEMALSEGKLLDSLNKYISSEYDNLKKMSHFLSERSKAVHLSSEEALQKLAEHPNGAYFLIKQFSQQWTPIANTHPGLTTVLASLWSSLPSASDFEGALNSLIRLQHVYFLSVDHMYAGNYSGRMGPPLQPIDTYLLGRQAFISGYLNESVQWLQLTFSLLKTYGTFPAIPGVFGDLVVNPVTLAQGASLLGLAYFFTNNQTKAQEMYNLSSALEPQGDVVLELKEELEGNQTYELNHEDWGERNMTVLCLRPKHQTVDKIRPIHVCRYKRAFGLSYLTYKEEILSLQPYASLFYDIISDDESDIFKQHIKGKMFRGKVGQGGEAKTDSYRTSDLAWVHDKDLTTAAAVSQRIKVITGLETDQRAPEGPSSAEAMQVVNYGIGGHYDAHVDPFDTNEIKHALLNRSGSRIATFLIYLSDVEAGGNTVFLNAGISVAPRKRMALFWYNFAPAMETIDVLTVHAACPVLIGEKWVANKWIWEYGNMFHRPCGPHPNSTQQHVEDLLASRRH